MVQIKLVFNSLLSCKFRKVSRVKGKTNAPNKTYIPNSLSSIYCFVLDYRYNNDSIDFRSSH